MTRLPRCAKRSTASSSVHQLQHPVPGRLAGAPEIRGWRLQYRLHCRALRQGLCRGGRAARRPEFPGALAAFVRRKSRERATTISGQLPGYAVNAGKDYVVITLAADGKNTYTPVHVDEFVGETGSARVKIGASSYEIRSNSRLNDICITGTVNGQAFTAQVERGMQKNPLALRLQHNGTRIEALVISPRMAELHQLMPFKAPPDLSRFVLSPMPVCWWMWPCSRPESAGRRARGRDRGHEDGERAVRRR